MNQLDNTENSIADTDETMVTSRRQIGKLTQLLSFIPYVGGSKPVVAVLRLSGIIGKSGNLKTGLNLENLNELIEKAFEIKKLEALCLIINSPGGSPVQSELIAKRIRFLAKKNKVPVYSFVEDMAASGGYWLACAGDIIYASKSSIIGSIGVIYSGFGFQEAIAKLGIERRVYTEGTNKSILDSFQPVKPNDIKIIKHLQSHIHEHFINYVKERRAGKLTQSDEFLFNGDFWCGQAALDFGLIDGIEDIYSFLQKEFGDDVKIEYISTKQSWFKKKFGLFNENLPKELADNIINSVENKLIQNKFNLN